MTTSYNAYDDLYQSLKKHLTVVNDNCEYTLGSFMRMKAHERCGAKNLPATVVVKQPVLQRVGSYISERLLITEAPSPEKTMKAFPARTSIAACLSALLVCMSVFSFAMFGTTAGEDNGYVVAEVTEEGESTLENTAEEK